MHSRLARDRYFNDFFRYISNSGQFSKTRQFIQHGDTSVYSHCVAVAYVSLWFSYRLHISVSKQSLLMGAFLHDYFLYDWHIPDKTHRLHGFTHPAKALENAKKDLMLNAIEKDIILRHMFPLTILPPMKRESWIVTLSDKICSFMETFNIHNINRKRHKFLPKGEKE